MTHEIEPLSVTFGKIKVEALPAKAFQGYAGRVHTTEAAAIIDKASNELADRYLKGCGTGAPTFKSIVDAFSTDPDLADATAALARFINMNRSASRTSAQGVTK